MGDPFELWKPYTFLGQFYTDHKDYEKAEINYKKAYEIVKDSDKRLPLGYVLYHLGQHYFVTQQFEAYEPIAERWIKFKNSSKFLNNDPGHRALLLFSDVENPLSEELLNAAIAFELNQNNFYISGLHHLDLGFILERKERYAEAIESYEFAAKYMSDSKASLQQSQAYYAIYEISKKINQDQQALTYLEKYQTVQDNIQQSKITKNLAELEIQYETEKKDLEIRQKTMQRNILIGSSGILGALALVIFFLLRNRLRNNKTLAKQASQLQEQKIKQLEQEKKLITFNAMIEGQENERKRIAKDLHDSIGGLLSSIKSYTTAVGESHPALESHPNYLKTKNLIDEACDETRRISHNMMPRALALSGLKPAVEDIAENLRRSGFNCDLEIIGLEKELDQNKSTMIFRMLQELVHNISKHAKAQNILIQMIQNEKTIELLVEDDGLGFDVSKLNNNGMGLSNIKSRVEFLQGDLSIDPVVGEGTTISISIPI